MSKKEISYVYILSEDDGDIYCVFGVFSNSQKAIDFFNNDYPHLKNREWEKDEEDDILTQYYTGGFYEIRRYEIDKEII